jgi:hypothetical protein
MLVADLSDGSNCMSDQHDIPHMHAVPILLGLPCVRQHQSEVTSTVLILCSDKLKLEFQLKKHLPPRLYELAGGTPLPLISRLQSLLSLQPQEFCNRSQQERQSSGLAI